MIRSSNFILPISWRHHPIVLLPSWRDTKKKPFGVDNIPWHDILWHCMVLHWFLTGKLASVRRQDNHLLYVMSDKLLQLKALNKSFSKAQLSCWNSRTIVYTFTEFCAARSRPYMPSASQKLPFLLFSSLYRPDSTHYFQEKFKLRTET